MPECGWRARWTEMATLWRMALFPKMRHRSLATTKQAGSAGAEQHVPVAQFSLRSGAVLNYAMNTREAMIPVCGARGGGGVQRRAIWPRPLLKPRCPPRARATLRRCAMSLRLPPELWEQIADYLRSDSLSQVCAALWHCPGRRYLKVLWSPARAADVLPIAANLRLLTLTVARADWLPTVVDPLRHATAMHTLILNLRRVQFGRAGAHEMQSLAGLTQAPALRTLTVNLQGSKVGPEGACALAALRAAPALHTLILNLQATQVGDVGARELAALKDAPALHTLTLNLQVRGEGGTEVCCACLCSRLAAAGWVDPPPLPLPRPLPPHPLASRSWPKTAGGVWPKSRNMKKKWPQLGSLGVQAIHF